jgi:hypothetical protein
MKKEFILLFLFLICCNELPIGEEELNSRGDFDALELELKRYNTLTEFNKYATLGKSDNLVVGKGEGYESRILLIFDFPDSSYHGLDEIKLILKRNDIFHKDTIKFSIHLLKGDFDETEANWYKRKSDSWWEVEGGDYEEDSIRLVEVKGDSIIAKFNYIELEKIQNAAGMIIIPQDNSGFVYFSARESGTAPEFILVKNDVVTSIPIQADCHILTGPEPFYIESWIGSGLPYRNYAKFIFDSLLIDKKAIYGELTFKIEKYFVMRDSIEIAVRELLEPIDDFNTPTGPMIALKKFAASDTLMNIDIVRHIQRIIEYPDSNFGFFLILSPDDYDIANLKFITGSHKLKVGYIPPSGER